jgi:hypothetical protein
VCRAATDSGDADFSLTILFAAIGRWALAGLPADGAASSASSPPLSEISASEPCWPNSDTDPRSRSFTAAECRGVLANLLLLNVDDPVGRVADLKPAGKGGGLRLDRDMLLDDEVGVHKLCCLLQYFASSMRLEGSADDSREVIFERCTSRGVDLADFKAQIMAAPPSEGLPRVTLHDAGMEAPAADGFVNFANAVFGYGEFIASCTQEEIIQVCSFLFFLLYTHVVRFLRKCYVHSSNRCAVRSSTWACSLSGRCGRMR